MWNEGKKILADLNNLYEDNPLDIDVSVLVRMENGCKGTIRSTQIATGLENNLNISVYGSKGSLSWEQENPNYLYYYTNDKPLQVLKPGHPYNSKISLTEQNYLLDIQKVSLMLWVIYIEVLPER